MRKQRRSPIKNASKEKEELFLTWNTEEEKQAAFAKATAGDSVKVNSTSASYDGLSFRDIDTRTNVRQEFTRDDYEIFRPSESLPRTQEQTIAMAMEVQKHVGLVKNIIDLMADFAVQGIGLVHPTPNVEKFYKEWFEKINGDERSERFVNHLFGLGTTVVRWVTAKLTPRQAERLKSALGNEIDPGLDAVQLEKRELPWRYIFLNPLCLEVAGQELAPFIGKPQFLLKLPAQYSKAAKDKNLKSLLDQIPNDIKQALTNGSKAIPLDPQKTQAYYYKKSDWEVWGNPLVSGILSDLIMLMKFKLSDIAALDGAISRIRLWKVGSLEHKILPTENLMNKLSDQLTNNVGGGTLDLLWNPAIELQETSTDVHKYLGEEKYKPCWNAIYSGLGIPPTLTGSATASGFTNNYISLKTLVERLNYARGMLLDFWNHQIRIVQKAMGFRFPAIVKFDRMTLSDEAAEKALLVQLVDRDIISVESVLERFGEMPELERARLNKEYRRRDKGTLPQKAGQWHNAQQDFEYKKIVLTSGQATPSEVGLELEERKDGEKTALEIRGEQELKRAQESSKLKGMPGQGRPKTSKDKTKRKQKRVLVRTSAMTWARDVQKTVANTITPIFLKMYGRKNLRQITEEESRKLENYKFSMMFQFSPPDPISKDTVLDKMRSPNQVESSAYVAYTDTVNQFVLAHKRRPTIDQLRDIQLSVYVSYIEDQIIENDEDDNSL